MVASLSATLSFCELDDVTRPTLTAPLLAKLAHVCVCGCSALQHSHHGGLQQGVHGIQGSTSSKVMGLLSDVFLQHLTTSLIV